ncbi:MAG: hypothetical protein U0703_19775 [Anaerolineae bacterium]
MVEWLGNATRAQPDTAPDVAIQHAGVNPYGINTFLEQEVEPAKRKGAMIAEAGFHWLRQEIPGRDIEIHARGDYRPAQRPGGRRRLGEIRSDRRSGGAVRAGNSGAHRQAAGLVAQLRGRDRLCAAG